MPWQHWQHKAAAAAVAWGQPSSKEAGSCCSALEATSAHGLESHHPSSRTSASSVSRCRRSQRSSREGGETATVRCCDHPSRRRPALPCRGRRAGWARLCGRGRGAAGRWQQKGGTVRRDNGLLLSLRFSRPRQNDGLRNPRSRRDAASPPNLRQGRGLRAVSPTAERGLYASSLAGPPASAYTPWRTRRPRARPQRDGSLRQTARSYLEIAAKLRRALRRRITILVPSRSQRSFTSQCNTISSIVTFN